MWLIFASLSAFFAGITTILAKIGIYNVDSNLATALRTAVVTVFSWLLVFAIGSHQEITTIDAKTYVFLILSGIATGLSWLCYFKALQLGDVNKVTPIDKSSTILTIIMAFIFLGESITPLKCICIILIGIGTSLMIEKKGNRKVKNINNNKWLIYAILSAIFASLTSILGKVGIEGVESNLGTAIRTVVVLIMAWSIVFFTKQHRNIKHITSKNWKFLISSGLTTGLSWLCYYRALQTGPASIVVPIDKLSIIVTIAFSYFVLHEKLTRKSLMGLILITFGTILLVL